MKKIRICILFLTTFSIFIMFNFAFAKTHESLVNDYTEISGLNEILSTLPGQIEAVSAQRLLTSENPVLEKKVASIFKSNFNITLVQQNLKSYLLQNTDKKLLTDLIEWMKTPLTSKIKAEELSSSKPESQADLLRYLADLQSNPPSQERIATIQEVEKVTNLTDFSTRIIVEMMRGFIVAFNLVMPEEKKQTMNEIEDQINKTRPILQESMRRQMILTCFYSYRNISNEELAEYIKFYRTNTGQEEIKIIGNALSYVLKQWFVDSGKKIALMAEEEAKK